MPIQMCIRDRENTPATDPPAGTETPEETPGDDSEPTPVEVVVFAAASRCV